LLHSFNKQVAGRFTVWQSVAASAVDGHFFWIKPSGAQTEGVATMNLE
jgi:hypothetical protein